MGVARGCGIKYQNHPCPLCALEYPIGRETEYFVCVALKNKLASLNEVKFGHDQVQWGSLGLGSMTTTGAGTPYALDS